VTRDVGEQIQSVRLRHVPRDLEDHNKIQGGAEYIAQSFELPKFLSNGIVCTKMFVKNYCLPINAEFM